MTSANEAHYQSEHPMDRARMTSATAGFTRRFLLSRSLTGTAGLILGHRTAHAQTQEQRHEIAAWVNNWSQPKLGRRAPAGALKLQRFLEPMYVLTDPITWTPNQGQERHASVTAPRGFVTDLTSVPRIFWSLLRPDGDYVYAAIIHDFLYWDQTRSRSACDEIFNLGLEDFNINSAVRWTLFNAVSKFGESAWNANAAMKKAGENRFIKRLPDSPLISWAKWKQQKNVF